MRLFNTFHDSVPMYLQQWIDRIMHTNGFVCNGDRLTGCDRVIIFISYLSHGICSWTIYRSNGDIDVGMFILEKMENSNTRGSKKSYANKL